MRLRIKQKGDHLLVMSKTKVRTAHEVLLTGIWDAVDGHARGEREVVFHVCDCDTIINPTTEQKAQFVAGEPVDVLGVQGTNPVIGEALLLDAQTAMDGAMTREWQESNLVKG